MFKSNKILTAVVLVILIAIAITSVSFANAAEPPSIVIIVPWAPDDLEISVFSDGEYEKATKVDKTIETYFAFYIHGLKSSSDYKVKINTEDKDFEIILNEQLKTYNNIFTLDLEKQTLKPGKLFSRTIALVSFRIILTLIIEGFVFFLFGYRQKKSWVIFLIINLLTQGTLNFWLSGFTPFSSYGIFFGLIFAEFWIFVVEMIALSFFITEQRTRKTILYVLIANLASLVVGGHLITILPL